MSSIALSRTLRASALRSLRRTGQRYASGHGHGPQFNEPSGYLFGEKVCVQIIYIPAVSFPHMIFTQPLPPGQQRRKEPWERIWFWGMYGSIGVATILLYYKPDTR